MRFLMRISYRALWLFMCLFPINKKKIVFQSFSGKGYGDNPKYIAERLLNTDLKLYWAVNDIYDDSVPEEITKIKYKSVKYLYHTATARVWVDNIRKPFAVKRRGQYYMQTWHGGLSIKQVERAVEDLLPRSYLKSAVRDALRVDVMLSDSEATTESIRKNFWYIEGEIIEKGLPRNDRLINFNKKQAEAIKNKHRLPSGMGFILYAPTFRKDLSLNSYDLDCKKCCEAFKKRFGGEWRVLIRLHPNLNSKSGQMSFDPDYAIDVSRIADIGELYLISDSLITDYSSAVFDFSLLNRPCFIYARDIEEYKKERSLAFDFKELPFPVCKSNYELAEEIASFNADNYRQNLKNFSLKVGRKESGQASAACAEWILNKTN